MKILIAGDLVINRDYDVSYINKNMIDLFDKSDYNIVNLEAPVTINNEKISKTGPNLKSNKQSTQKILKTLNIDLVTLANNHILDYDEQGVMDTIQFCNENNIQTVGAGNNLRDASKTLFIDTKEGKIAIVNFCENEWTCATDNSAGANPMDIIDNINQITSAKDKADFVFVIVHGGNEHNHYPSPRMIKQYRFYAENGADAVVGHHTHCVSGYERHQNVPIFYSLGNFLFPMDKTMKEGWYSGLVVQFYVQKDHEINFELIPVIQNKSNYSLSIAEGMQKENVLKTISNVNKAIKDPILLEKKWQEFVKTVTPGFIKVMTPMAGFNNRYIKAFLYRTAIYKWFFNAKYVKEHLNRIRCEAHHDVAKAFLEDYIKSNLNENN